MTSLLSIDVRNTAVVNIGLHNSDKKKTEEATLLWKGAIKISRYMLTIKI